MSSDQEGCEEPELGVETEEIICETVFLKSEEDDPEEDDDTPSETYSVEGQRPVRPVERQKMRPWLIDLLDKNILPGLSWQNKRENIFRISWKHAAHNCFNRNRDSDLFERWAFHTGRHHEGNHKRWKANFRCALNSLPDVMELKELGVRKGDNAFKVYKFLDSPEPTMKEKMEIKRKYSLMAGIKLDESHSGSSTPTVSTAPSSPEREGSSGVDGGIQTLLKAIELKTQQQTSDMSKTPQKRGSSGGTTQTRSKRAKKDSRDDAPVETEATVVICSGRPSPASTPGSDTISGVQKMPYITAIDPTSGIPYVTAVDQKTGKLTLVQLRKTDSPSAPTTPTGRSEILIPSSKMLMSLPGQGQSVMAVPQTQTITSTLKYGEHFITVPMSVAASLQKETTAEEKVTIPVQLLQQELQKQAQQAQQAQQGVPNLINLGNLFASNPAAAIQLAKQMSTSTGSIPLPVLEQISQAKLQEAQQKITDKTVPKTVIQTEVQQGRMVATPQVSECLPPVPQLNKNITSIAAALRMSIPSTQPSSPSVVTGTPSPIQQSQPVSTTTMGPGLAQDPQGIRSKLVSRLMVSGSSMTNQSPGVRMPVQSLIQTPTSTPRPRLDHILVKPNPNLTLPSTHLQPVRTSDMVVMSTASSSSLDFVTGPPKLMTAVSERTIDLNANKSTLAIPSTSTQLKNSRETDVVSIGSSPSPVCTPELRPDILDRQLTIELSKMEKEPSTQRTSEESQHLSDNYSRRTVQTQCNMFLWNYLNGKMEEAGKSDLFTVLGPMPPTRKSVWTQCAFVENAALEYSPSMNTGHCLLQSGEENSKKRIIQEALGILRSPQYKVLDSKVYIQTASD
ncbi:uncharacterized protein LOC127721485 isoform X3 [Mytilus californianus]|uniref:uncharacterized protein LOC127721485 isoform X3 n=1 Tax=Mytilus californianus TaxID=6549 RepID=UPI0022479538|nr:uncharacterized protein LOC127721485 isoform X3 [Mytilus californianus]